MANDDLLDEDQLLAWLRRRPEASPLLGNDAAVLPAEAWAVTMDTQIEGVHFQPATDPALVARRLLAVNLSDLAAMGALPAYGFLALAAPPAFDHRRFFKAFLAAAQAHGLELAGGDLARSPRLAAVLTLLGRKPEGGRFLERSEARPGEVLWLGGTVGESAAGAVLVARGARLAGRRVELPADFAASAPVLRAARRAVRRHLLPTPQLELGRFLGGLPRGAAIDLSDGLARDLHRLCQESGVGAEVDLGRLPLAPGFRGLAEHLGKDAHELALGGGEDYVLLFTLPPGVEPPAARCRAIGHVRGDRRVLVREGAATSPLPPLGWDHLSVDR